MSKIWPCGWWALTWTPWAPPTSWRWCVAQRAFYTAQLDSARKTFAAGSGTRTDIDEVQARLDMVAAFELEARQNVGYAKRQLQALVGEPVETLAGLNVAKLELARAAT